MNRNRFKSIRKNSWANLCHFDQGVIFLYIKWLKFSMKQKFRNLDPTRFILKCKMCNFDCHLSKKMSIYRHFTNDRLHKRKFSKLFSKVNFNCAHIVNLFKFIIGFYSFKKLKNDDFIYRLKNRHIYLRSNFKFLYPFYSMLI